MRTVRVFRPNFAIALLLCSSLVSFAQKCFLPNGTDRNLGLNRTDYKPCTSGSDVDEYRMCCAAWDACGNDGLCLNGDYGTNVTWRESCTDPTWKSVNCIKVCVDGFDYEGHNRSNTDERITACPDGSYCCGAHDVTCCNRRKGFWIVNGTATDVNPASATHSTAFTGAPAAALGPSYNPPSSKDTGSVVGGAVGGVAALGLVGSVAYFVLRRKRRRQQESQQQTSREYKGLEFGVDKRSATYISEMSATYISEMDGSTHTCAMGADKHIARELQGDTREHELE